MTYKKGILWALGTALISGVSIYINKFGVAQVSDPFIYTTVKNTMVAIAFIAALGLLAGWKEMRAFTRRQWLGWLTLGLIGGGIPFLLFFQGLTTASAANASLIQKTLFLWVALLGVQILREKLGWWQIAGLGVLAVGHYVLQPPSAWTWGSGEMLILIATLMWAVETIVAKKVLSAMSARTAALGRMGVGAIVMWLFIALTARTQTAATLDATQLFWVAITAAFLFGYVWTWYSALKFAPCTVVATVLTLGAIITIALTAVFEEKFATTSQVVALIVMALGALAFMWRPRVRMTEAAKAA